MVKSSSKFKEVKNAEEYFEELQKFCKDVPKAEIERGAQKIKNFIDGKIGWSELFDFTPQMLNQMAEFGYLQFQQGRYPDAERVFKVLTVLDWDNYYYHSMMGSILQRQKRYGEAIAEYSQAIVSYPDDVVSLANRGEVYMQHELFKEAKADFKMAIELDPKGDNKWANRARMLLLQLEDRLKKESKVKVKPKKKG